MTDQRIQDVLAIEEQAQAIRDAATKQADEMPRLAQREAQALTEKAHADAEAEGRSIVEKARSEETHDRVLSEFEANAKRSENLAMSNFDRAVSYVLCSVVGKG